MIRYVVICWLIGGIVFSSLADSVGNRTEVKNNKSVLRLEDEPVLTFTRFKTKVHVRVNSCPKKGATRTLIFKAGLGGYPQTVVVDKKGEYTFEWNLKATNSPITVSLEIYKGDVLLDNGDLLTYKIDPVLGVFEDVFTYTGDYDVGTVCGGAAREWYFTFR